MTQTKQTTPKHDERLDVAYRHAKRALIEIAAMRGEYPVITLEPLRPKRVKGGYNNPAQVEHVRKV